jgi:carboxyl-terminal processing protease
MRTRWAILTIAAALLVGGGAWLLRMRLSPREPTVRIVGTRLFESVFSHVRSYAVDSLDDQELYRRAAAGVIDELDDPYAELLLPGGPGARSENAPAPLGLFLDRRDGAIIVVATVPGSPAESAGVRSGDRLVGVDSVPLDATRLDLALRRLDGPADSRVLLRVRRTGTAETLALAAVRRPVVLGQPIALEMLSGGIARVRVRRFVPGLADTIERRLDGLRGKGLHGIALDLRGVVGGLLADGVALADLFLGPGQRLATSRSRDPRLSRAFRDSTVSPFDSLPLAVLVNGGTAGAAEAAAGALQDHDRGAVLGSMTFGRGVTMQTYPLGQGAAIRLTTALWVTPSGREIQRAPLRSDGDSVPRPRRKTDAGRTVLGGGGIIPDREVADTGTSDLVLAEARSLLIRAGTTRGVMALLARW